MVFKELCLLVCIVSVLAQIRTPTLSRSGSASSQISLAASGGAAASSGIATISEQIPRLGSLSRSASSFALPNRETLPTGGRLGVERLQPQFDINGAQLSEAAVQNIEANLVDLSIRGGERRGIDRLQSRFDGNVVEMPQAMQNFEANRAGAAPPLMLRQASVHCYISHHSHSVCLFEQSLNEFYSVAERAKCDEHGWEKNAVFSSYEKKCDCWCWWGGTWCRCIEDRTKF